jgi:hypothetical protein
VRYQEIITFAKAIQSEATLGGVLCMLGAFEVNQNMQSALSTFAADFKTMVATMRADLGMPNLPFLSGNYEDGATGAYSTQSAAGKIAVIQLKLVVDSANYIDTISSVGCAMLDEHHYNTSGQNTWTARVVATIDKHGWFPISNVQQVFTSVSVTPATATIAAGATRQFTATALDQSGGAIASQPTFTWTASGGGTISSNGLFTAGTALGGPYTVTASSGGKSGTSNVTVSNIVTTSINDYTTGTGNNQFEFVGSWTAESQTGAYNNDGHWACGTTDYYQIRFNGTQVAVYAKKANNHGILAISIDGGTETNADLYSAATVQQALVWTSALLSSGQHTLKVRISGIKNASSSGSCGYADRVDVTSNGGTHANLMPRAFAQKHETPVAIYSVTGKRIGSYTAALGPAPINFSSVPHGVYLLGSGSNCKRAVNPVRQ